MAEGRRKFTKEFKVEAVRLVKEGGRTLSQVARDLGVNVGVLGKWCRQLEEHSTDAFPGKGRLMPQEEELRRLKRENEDLKEDRAILKKAPLPALVWVPPRSCGAEFTGPPVGGRDRGHRSGNRLRPCNAAGSGIRTPCV